MRVRVLLFTLLLAGIVTTVASADEPKAVALDAINSLFIENDLADSQTYLASDAVQGDKASGSAADKLAKQPQKMLESVQLHQIVFFKKGGIERLRTSYPDDLWTRVQNHIGEQQGVLVKLELSGELAERASAAGNDPRNVAMMTFILDSGEDPEIVHVDDN